MEIVSIDPSANLFDLNLGAINNIDVLPIRPHHQFYNFNNSIDVEDIKLKDLSNYTTIKQPLITLSGREIINPLSPIISNSLNTNNVNQNLANSNLIKLNQFQQDPRFKGINGQGYSVAVIDTGINVNHPFFGADQNKDGISDRIIYQYDFADRDFSAIDRNGHGSHVSSIIAAENVNYLGVAKGVNLISLKVFSDSGEGSFSYIEEALQWVIANATKYNILAVNLSVGDQKNWHNITNPYNFNDEFATLNNMGITPIVAGGNEFYTYNSEVGVNGIAANNHVIGVGAIYGETTGKLTYASGAIAYNSGISRITPFSQRHSQFTSIFAPGAPIIAAGKDDNLLTMEGTSQAAAFVTGAVVLAQQLAINKLNRYLSFSEIKQLITTTGTSINDGDNEDDNVKNTGLNFKQLDILALAEAILKLPPTLPTITIAATDAIAGEDNNEGVFTFTRTGLTNNSLTANYNLSGSAINGQDYQTLTGKITFAAGAKTTTIKIKPIDDRLFENNETIQLTLTKQSNYSIGNSHQAIVTILDNDRPTISIKSTDSIAAETPINQVINNGKFTLTRTGNLRTGLTVYYRIGGTATNGIDYHNLSGKIIFAPGFNTTTINIRPIDDKLAEHSETITLTLLQQNSYNLSLDKTATITIVDNDLTIQNTYQLKPSSNQVKIDISASITSHLPEELPIILPTYQIPSLLDSKNQIITNQPLQLENILKYTPFVPTEQTLELTSNL